MKTKPKPFGSRKEMQDWSSPFGTTVSMAATDYQRMKATNEETLKLLRNVVSHAPDAPKGWTTAEWCDIKLARKHLANWPPIKG